MSEETVAPVSDCAPLIPLAIVRLNRLTILLGVIAAYVLHVPLITTALFIVVALAASFGRRASLLYRIGSLAFRTSESASEGEDPRLRRFNNSLAAIILGAAQIAFLLHAPLLAWIFAGLAALAAAVALAGFCLGCFLFYQFRLHRTRLFNSTAS